MSDAAETARDRTGDRFEAVRDVLRAISRSPFDLDGVLDIVVERLTKLCNADIGMVYLPAAEGQFRAAAGYAMRPEHVAYERSHPTPVTSGTVVGRVVLSGHAIQIEDAANDPTYTWKEGQRVGGFRTILGVPVRKELELIGTVGLARMEVRPFSADEIELVETFADQAAIVIENVRLVATIERQRQELSRYLSSPVVDLISRPDGEQLLAGHRRQATAVYCDLRGFTAFSETAEPEELFGVLREYHGAMGALIIEHGGTLEHFAGDGIMIFFNDPVPQDDHVERAVRMAVAMRERFGELASGWRKRAYELGFGVGIATGYATLGRIGFEGRYDYGMIGTAVIMASRLSSEAKAGQILLSPRAHAAIEELVDTEPVGELTLKGFTRPVRAVNVVALRSRMPAAAN